MLKNALIKGINSFCYSIGICVATYAIVGIKGYIPLLPEYEARFSSQGTAMIVQLFLIGLMSAALAAGTAIFELERLSLVAQSIIYFIVSSAVWIPVGCFCWGLNKYVVTVVSMSISYLFSYVICWVISYKSNKKNIQQINERLVELRISDSEQW